MPIKEGYCQTDTDGLIYRREDTFWLIWPDHITGDPGVLDAKPGAIPVPDAEGFENEPNQT